MPICPTASWNYDKKSRQKTDKNGQKSKKSRLTEPLVGCALCPGCQCQSVRVWRTEWLLTMASLCCRHLPLVTARHHLSMLSHYNLGTLAILDSFYSYVSTASTSNPVGMLKFVWDRYNGKLYSDILIQISYNCLTKTKYINDHIVV